MIAVQHFGSISGGKDSQAVLCLMVERIERKGMAAFGNRAPRFLCADNGHENPITLEHIAYLSDWLRQRVGLHIEIVSANDVPGLTDAAAFARKRGMLREEWSKEKRRTRHKGACNQRRDAWRAGLLTRVEWMAGCDCPVLVSPPVPDHLIERALGLLHPTGIPFLDMAMLHGRFPGTKTRFCTDETKLIPMMHRKRPLLDAGVPIIDWIGERADESPARAKKPPIQSKRYPGGARQVLYRPIFRWSAADAFAISERHGLRHNPLYTMGMSRVGCSTCIMVRKRELRVWSMRFPAEVDRVREWERLVSLVSRRSAVAGTPASLLPARTVPGDPADHGRATIDRAIAWSRTSRGGRNYDLFIAQEQREADEHGLRCDSEYGLCE
ncbi:MULTISPECIES: phosphoadenosine phosphosulfate reductase domain-containing protein [Sphingomonadaceae]|jgi:3'-phosphoadenosine 5'-phosphosulfate sulfotransferase (PAPS reductase)/FAD synthetase|uniref:Phosphoadenosine phosphosulfate reductase family protein n=1 Tax=Sphingomonas sanguinis TaxID=33051 RepID=A0A7Y7QWX7_9SPHN|nr:MULTISPECIES: phosphoadenosine phosphosulfate reductase family protein [Sphingomonadaceae]MBX9665183.1 phosphoadenosine phosphosulfate reductase family protein [Novosphingobium sp.]MBZ6382643.1 phosphoadenosine phosphosulfate reductase family protein [Sphingomonas sanguinis]NNG50151.1 phosphoadenosine phosphosulfate reductase family protein [Sphingomonas sanguinis]NNG54527.1 phosphoadenosine phosphosulfate reductase family protein [Sphingomonas sanguinis]NVP31941.1 phosphoadenosine phosphos